MKWGIMGIIGIAMVGLLVTGAFGNLVSNGASSDVSTSVSVVDGKKVPVNEVKQGDTVYIKITVTNNGDSAFPLSNHAPVFAYAKIYQIVGNEKIFVEMVKYESKFVAWHVVSLPAHSNYTTALQWTVPSNISGYVEIDAWAGNAPIGSTVVYVDGNQVPLYDNEFVVITTDSVVYAPGETVHITIMNLGDRPALFGAGFKVVGEDNKVIMDKTQRHMVELQPGDSVEYTFKIPQDIEEGWYYIYDYANDDYAMIYIL